MTYVDFCRDLFDLLLSALKSGAINEIDFFESIVYYSITFPDDMALESMISLRKLEWPKESYAVIADNTHVVCTQYGMYRYDRIRDEWFDYDVTAGNWCEEHGSRHPCSKCGEDKDTRNRLRNAQFKQWTPTQYYPL